MKDWLVLVGRKKQGIALAKLITVGFKGRKIQTSYKPSHSGNNGEGSFTVVRNNVSKQSWFASSVASAPFPLPQGWVEPEGSRDTFQVV